MRPAIIIVYFVHFIIFYLIREIAFYFHNEREIDDNHICRNELTYNIPKCEFQNYTDICNSDIISLNKTTENDNIAVNNTFLKFQSFSENIIITMINDTIFNLKAKEKEIQMTVNLNNFIGKVIECLL